MNGRLWRCHGAGARSICMVTGERSLPGLCVLLFVLSLSGCSAFRQTVRCSTASASPLPLASAAHTVGNVAPPAEMTFSEFVDKALINPGCCEKPPTPEPVRTDRVLHFDSGSVALSADAQLVLLRHAFYLKRHPGARVQVEGHADEQGTPEYGLELGERRARAVADFLLAHGARPVQVTTVSFGATRPLGWEEGAESRVQNRRVELFFLEP